MSVKTDLAKFQKKLLKDVDKLKARKLMNILGKEAISIMKKRIRGGFGVNKSGQNAYRFPRLSTSYIKQRKRLRLSPFTTPGKSNVTRSGRLIASLRYTTNTGQAIITPTGRNSNGLSNIELAEILSEKGRVFMNLSKNEQAKLVSFLRRRKRDLIRD